MSHWNIASQIHYPLISDVMPAADGSFVVFCVREPLMTEDRSEFLTHIWLARNPAGAALQLTYGEQSEYSPVVSPDSRYLAFVTTHSERSELRAMHIAGGESWLLATLKNTAISSPRWSRDGTQIAFLAAAPPSEELERARRAKDDAYAWGTDERNALIYSVPFNIAPSPVPVPQAITTGSFHITGFDWLTDGSGMVLAAMPSPNADGWPDSWLARVPHTGGEATRLADLSVWSAVPFVSPAGDQIACIVSDGAPRWANAARVALCSPDGGGLRVLADTPDTQPAILGWLPDGSGIVIQEYEHVGARVFILPTDGSAARPLTGPATFESAGANQGIVAVVGEDFQTANLIAIIDLFGGPHMPLYAPALPTGWPEAQLPQAEVLGWHSADGTAIEGIVTYPLNYTPGQRVPLVVVVHGGPTGVYQRSYLGSPSGYAPIGMLAEQGYATLRCNPRGSSGYGRDFRFANIRDWGGGDLQDIMAGVDTLIARGIADPERLAIMGWSYGGFMASWAITQTDRFKVACIGAPVTDPVSFNGTADIPGFIPDYFGGEYWDDFESYRSQSPILHVGKVQTPALIQHGAADIRVPLSQGRQFYAALRRRGIPTELIVYPRQGHSFHEPRLIIDCRKRVVEWLGKHLGSNEAMKRGARPKGYPGQAMKRGALWAKRGALWAKQ